MTTNNLVSIEGGGITTFERAAARLMNKLMNRKDWVWLQGAMMLMLGQENRFFQVGEDFDAFFYEAYKKYGCPNCGKKGVPHEDGLLSCIECLRAEDEEGGAE